MKTLSTLALLILLGFWARPGHAQDFTYEPKNPAFGGGNPFNYAWLQASATAQNMIEDPSKTAAGQPDPLAQFASNVNQQVLSQLTSRLIASQFGTGAIKPGSYTVGGYQVNVTQGANGVEIVVIDVSTGNQTTVTIPKGL